ncbi:MAG: conjugal transfer protein TraX [Clostridiales bacterium]|nr:conjugal transfer protein TraX [Clostridiales bacterium]
MNRICTADKPLNRDVIKYIAMAAMLLNHIGNIFLKPGLLRELFLDVGYFTAPVMCYFLVEGYGYTRSKRKYGERLLLFALLSEIPFCLAFTEKGLLEFQGLNMIFTLFLCFLLLVAGEKLGENRAIPVYILLFLLSAFCDWAFLAPMFTWLFLHGQKTGAPLRRTFGWVVFLFWLTELQNRLLTETGSLSACILKSLGAAAGPALAAFVILYLYNGKRAARGQLFSKWFFYIFYPAHLLLLGVLRLLL